MDQLQQDLDQWMLHDNQERTPSGKYCFGKTPMQIFYHSIPLAKQRLLETLKEEEQWLDTSLGTKTIPISGNLQHGFLSFAAKPQSI